MLIKTDRPVIRIKQVPVRAGIKNNRYPDSCKKFTSDGL